jgi:SAM-dependent methyltransferase
MSSTKDSVGSGIPMAASASSCEIRRILETYARRDSADQRYSFFDAGNLLRLQELDRRLLKRIASAQKKDLANRKILEIGCGAGYWIRKFVEWGARPDNLSGIDLLAARVAQARRLCPASVHIKCGDASRTEFASASFDIVLQATVFTSILDPGMKAALALEMLRLLRQDGVILWYDFFVNNPGNPHVSAIGKRELRSLFPCCRISCEKVTVAPPVGRLLGRTATFAYHAAATLRFLSTHYLAVIQKEGWCGLTPVDHSSTDLE